MDVLFIFKIVVLVFSVVVHEISHGFVALYFGDPTAQRAKRLTLNPINHIDLFGSILLPLLMAMTGGVIFGWAKPVPVDPRFFKRPERDMALVSAAGPLSNLTLALVFGLLYRGIAMMGGAPWIVSLQMLFMIIVITNVALAVFNLMPIPPLDGSGILLAALPRSAHNIKMALEQYGLVIFLVFVIFGASLISPIIEFIARLMLGV